MDDHGTEAAAVWGALKAEQIGSRPRWPRLGAIFASLLDQHGPRFRLGKWREAKGLGDLQAATASNATWLARHPAVIDLPCIGAAGHPDFIRRLWRKFAKASAEAFLMDGKSEAAMPAGEGSGRGE